MKKIAEKTEQLAAARDTANTLLNGGAYKEGLEALDVVIALAQELGDRLTELVIHLEKGRVLRHIEDFEGAAEVFDAGVERCRATEQPEFLLRFQFEQSRVLWATSRFDEALALLAEASESSQRLLNRTAELQVRLELAHRLFERGRFEEAEQEADWCRRLGMSTQQHQYALQSVFLRMRSLRALERFDEAFEVSVDILRNLPHLSPTSQVEFAAEMATIQAARGKADEAIACLDECRRALIDPSVEVEREAIQLIIDGYRALDQEEKAVQLEGRVSLADRSRDKLQERVDSLREEGEEAYTAGDMTEAKRIFEEALKASITAEDQQGHIEILKSLSLVAEATGANEVALEYLGQAAQYSASLQNLSRTASVMYEYGRMQFLSGKLHDAIATLREVEKIQGHTGETVGLGRSKLILASCFSRLGLFAEAGHMLEAAEGLIGGQEPSQDCQIAYERACITRQVKGAAAAIPMFDALIEDCVVHKLDVLHGAALAQKGESLRALERFDEAIATFEMARDPNHRPAPRVICYVDHWQGLALLAKDDPAAVEYLTRAWNDVRELGADPEVLRRFKQSAEVVAARFDVSQGE